MNATAIFNPDGTITLRTKNGKKATFTTTSEAVNYCKERNISAKFQ